MDGCLCTCRPHPSAPATVPICHGGKNYEDLLKEDKSEPIPFIGNNVDDFTPNALVIVSFPGAYGRAWNFLTKEAAKAESGLNSKLHLFAQQLCTGLWATHSHWKKWPDVPLYASLPWAEAGLDEF